MTQHRIKWTISKADLALVKKIVERMMGWSGIAYSYDRTDMEMDLIATHANGTPMNFQKLLDVPDDTFIHDVFGIRNHLNRATGKLEGHFLPRCAQPERKRP